MLTPDYLMTLPDPVVKIWAEVETDIMANIARRLAENGNKELTNSMIWQLEKVQQMNGFNRDIKDILAKATKLSNAEVEQLIEKAGMYSLQNDERIYKAMGYVSQQLAMTTAIRDVLKTGISATQGVMKNFTQTTANAAQETFVHALDKAYFQIISGAYSPTQAYYEAVKSVADDGIKRHRNADNTIGRIRNPKGTTNKIDVAVRRAILTGANKTTGDLQLARSKEIGNRFAKVTEHGGARPEHAIWQGGIYDLVGREQNGNFYDETGYGTGEGLCGWGCYHNFYPYFEGFSYSEFTKGQTPEDEQLYKDLQTMRGYERTIRETKRSLYLYDECIETSMNIQGKLIYKKEFQRKAALLKRQQARLDKFADERGLLTDPTRTWVHTQNRSYSQRVRRAYEEHEKNKPKSKSK